MRPSTTRVSADDTRVVVGSEAHAVSNPASNAAASLLTTLALADLHVEARERLLQDDVLRLLRAGLAPGALGVRVLPADPQHLAEVDRDLGIGAQLVGALEVLLRVGVVAESVLHPTETVE